MFHNVQIAHRMIELSVITPKIENSALILFVLSYIVNQRAPANVTLPQRVESVWVFPVFFISLFPAKGKKIAASFQQSCQFRSSSSRPLSIWEWSCIICPPRGKESIWQVVGRRAQIKAEKCVFVCMLRHFNISVK